MCLRNLWDLHEICNQEYIFEIFEKIFKRLTGREFFIFAPSSFLKIGLTVAALACFKYLFKDISLLIILPKWQSIAEIPSGPLALFILSDLIILLMSLLLACGRSNLFPGIHNFLIFWMLRWLLYTEIVSLTII